MRLRISDLKHRVRLERVSRVSDGGGGGADTWALVDEFWAAVVPAQSTEPFQSEQHQGSARHHVFCRYRTDVRLSDRLVLGTRRFDIQGIMNVNDDAEFLKLSCEEILS